jgi:flagellar protein FliO/FliZ
MKGLSHVTKQRKLIMSLLWTILLVSFMSTSVVLAEQSSIPNDIDSDGYWKNLLFVFFVLIVILGMIILLIRFLSIKNRSWMSNRSIKSLSGIQLGQNKSVQVVEIGRSIYVIGVGDNVELIEKIDQAEEISFIKDSLHNQNSVIGTEKLAFIGSWFNKLRSSMNKDANDETAVSFQEVFNNKMNQVSDRKKRVEEILSEQKDKERSRY